jgi:hypothetical protein
MKSSIGRLSLLLIFVLLVVSLPWQPAGAQDGPLSPTADTFSPQVAVDWIQLWYDRVMAHGVNPPSGGRLYGYAGVTLYQAVLPGMPINNSYANQLNGLTDFPVIDNDKVYDWVLTANAAMKTLMVGLLPDNADTAKAAAALFDKYVKQRQADGIKDDVIKRSEAFGVATAQHILAWAAEDQYKETRDLVWSPPEGEAAWVPTTKGANPVEPFWGNMRPFALTFSAECAERMNMPFSTDKNSTFYKQAMEVRTVGDKLTKEQKDTALYWLDNLKETGTPGGHWMLIGAQIVTQLKLHLARSVEMFSLLGITIADAFTSCWTTKYVINLLRPETYIKQHISPQWNPFIQTPSFPEFPSGHSVVSAAAAETLTFMFGTVAFTDRAKTRFGMPPRDYLSFYDAADEAAWSRLYGGIHYRLGIESGLKQGYCVSRAIISRIDMKPVPQGE